MYINYIYNMDSFGVVYLNSDDNRNNLEDPADMTFYMRQTSQKIAYIGLASYDFMIGFQNINSNNNRAYFETSTQSYEVILNKGFYDYDGLRTELINQFNALGLGVWSISFTDNIYALIAPVPVKFIDNPANPDKRDFVDMIAIKKNTDLKASHIGGCADIAYTNKIYIMSNDIHSEANIRDSGSSGRISNCLGVVYTNPNKYMGNDKIITEVDRPRRATERIQHIKWVARAVGDYLSVINIRLLDDRGLPLLRSDLGDGSINWSIELYIKSSY